MDTAEFLRHVLPSKGYYFLAIPNPTRGYKHTAFETPEALAEAALAASAEGHNAFFSVAGYEEPEYVDDKGTKHWRTGENALGARCFWMDIDCDVQYGGSQKAGIVDMQRFCKETDLPVPNFIVNSGNGVHIYWLMDADIPADQWRKVAAVIKGLAKQVDFAQDDTTRTADIASVLRPIGCNNDKSHKNKGVKEVKLLRADTNPVSFPAFVRAVEDAKVKFGVTTRQSLGKSNGLNSDLMVQYPPTSAEIIATHCNQLAFFRDYRGKEQSEPQWRSCLSIVRNCVEGDALAHTWSSGHLDYDFDDTQTKLDNITGPHYCDTFRGIAPELCRGCKHQCKTPMQLGQVPPESVGEVFHAAPDASEGVEVEFLPELPAELRADFRLDPKQGVLARSRDEEGVDTWQVICTMIFMPNLEAMFYKDEEKDSQFKIRMVVRVRPFVWRETDLDSRVIGVGGATLMGDLSGRALIASRNDKLMTKYLRTWIEVANARHDEVTMHNHLGWQEDNSFVLGNVRYYPDGTEREVVLTQSLRAEVNRLEYKPVGDFGRYVELIDQLYNRPGHEAYQFTYLAGFASTLLHMLDPNPRGVLFSAWSGETGLGKSTVARLAAGIWYNPARVVDASGTTPFALFANAGLRRNLPYVLDEVTQWPREDVGNFAYRYSSGKGKEGGKTDGTVRNVAHMNWCNIAICTGNSSMHESMRLYIQDCGAQLARVFEYKFDKETQTASAEEGRKIFQELSLMHGVPSVPYVRYVVQNYDEVKTLLEQTVLKFMQVCNLEKQSRYWLEGVAAVYVVYQVTKALGIQNFDGAPLFKWMRDHLVEHDVALKGSGVDYLSAFGDALRDLYSGFIATYNRGSKSEPARILPGWSMPNKTITGRSIADEGVVYLSIAEFNRWCKDQKIDRQQMVAELERVKYIRKTGSVRLGAFTNIPSAVVRVFELDLKLIEGNFRVVGKGDTLPSLLDAHAQEVQHEQA